jgi:hypothetical protein
VTAKEAAAEALTSLLLDAERRTDGYDIAGARNALCAIGVTLAERRSGYVWSV